MKYLLFAMFFGGAIIAGAQDKRPTKTDSAARLVQAENLRKIDSLKALLPTASPSKRFDINYELFGRYLNVDFETASVFLDSCLAQSVKSNDSLWIVKTAHASGYVLRSRGDLKGAISRFEFGLAIAKRNNFRDQVKYLLNNLALSYTSSASYDKALSYNFESLRIREIDGNARDITTALNNIGLLYEELEDYSNALEFYRRSYDIKLSNDIHYDLEKSLINIGGVLTELGEFEEAEKKIMEALAICTRNQCGIEILAQANLALGTALLNQQKNQECAEYLKKSLQLHKRISQAERLVLAYYGLAKLRLQQGDINEAKFLLDSSQSIAEKGGFQKRILRNYLLYSNIYGAAKDFEKAYGYQGKFIALNTEIMNGNLVNRISAIQMDFKQRENINKINSQSALMQLQKQAIDLHQRLNLLIGIVTILLVGIIWILYNSNRQKQHINEMLDQRVRERTSELERNRDELKHAHDEQILVLRKVSGDLKSSLATFKGLSYAAQLELPIDKAVYFKVAEAAAERIFGYVNQFSAIDDVPEL